MNRRSSRPLRGTGEREKEIQTVTAIYRATGALEAARRRINHDTMQANKALESLPHTPARETLLWFSGMLLRRNY